MNAHQREHTRLFARPERAGQGLSQAAGKEGSAAVVWSAGHCTGWAWEEWEEDEEEEDKKDEDGMRRMGGRGGGRQMTWYVRLNSENIRWTQ